MATGESSSKVLILFRLMKWKAFTYLRKKQVETSGQEMHPASITQEAVGPASQLEGTASPPWGKCSHCVPYGSWR